VRRTNAVFPNTVVAARNVDERQDDLSSLSGRCLNEDTSHKPCIEDSRYTHTRRALFLSCF